MSIEFASARGFTWIAGSLAWLAVATTAGDELVLKEADHKSIGTALREVRDGKDAAKTEKAKKNLVDTFTRIGKAQKKPDAMQAALALTNDIGHALAFLDEHKLPGGIKIGGISNGNFEVPSGAKSDKITYAVWTPKNYKPSGEPIPAIFFIPGTKEGKNYAANPFLVENWVDPAIRDKALLVAVDMPEDTKLWGVLATDDGKQGGISYVMRTFGKIKELFAIDPDRTYIAGREIGVAVALKTAGMFPERFAGVIGQSGDAIEVAYDNYLDLPSFFAGGGTGCATFQEKTKAAGFDNCTIKQDGKDIDAFNWTQDHKRVANPTKVALVLGDPAPLQAYWVVCARQEVSPGTRVDAEIDRASNKLTIKAKNVRRVTIYFNDVMLDLDKPIKVSCNGVEHEEKVGRNLDDLVTFVNRGICDIGRVYVASKSYDIPPAKE